MKKKSLQMLREHFLTIMHKIYSFEVKLEVMITKLNQVLNKDNFYHFVFSGTKTRLRKTLNIKF